MGSIYKRGNKYWIKYYRRGRSYRESSGSDKKMVAINLLKMREGEIAEGKTPSINFEKVTFDELAHDFLQHYRITGRKSLDRAERSVKHLNTYFEGVRVPYITSPQINTYIEARQEVAANATINRELSALKTMFNLGLKQTPPKVSRVPHIPMLKENNIRRGFFEHEAFLALRAALPEYLKGFVTFAYKTGWRVSEITGLTWARIDREKNVVRLEAGETKNDEGRILHLDDELMQIIELQWNLRKEREVLAPYVFPNRRGTGRIRDFRYVWKKACIQSHIGNRIFHDFRRTAIRNMIRAGVPESVAMKISGHKTRSVFDRYNIVDENDLKDATQKVEAYIQKQNEQN
jgi:integrase